MMNLKNIITVLLTICITTFSFSQAAYVTSNFGNPWGSIDYNTCMDNVFGAGAWDDLDFQTANAATLFSPAYTTIYLEGSDANALDLAAFLTANQALIEAWVMAGGFLYINAAPNIGGNINIGFGGVMIVFDNINLTDCGDMAIDIAGNCLITDSPVDITAAFPICGSFFAHATISGPGILPILEDDATGIPILAELPFGAGNLVIGGLTAPQFHTPEAEAKTLLENILTNVGCSRCGPTFTLTPNCQLGDEDNFYITIDITDAGDDPSGYTVNGGAFADITAVGTYTVGPFPNGTANITFDGITTDCSLGGSIDFDCTCDPLAVNAGADQSYCPTEDPPVDLAATLEDVIPGGPLGTYTVTTSAPGSCTATPDGASTPLPLFDDDAIGPIPLPFSFDYFGNTYNDVYVGSNGYITFEGTTVSLGGGPIPDAFPPNDMIALLLSDLDPSSGGTVSYFTSTLGGQTCFVVEFSGVPYFASASTITGQMILCADGSITINCIDCQSLGFGIQGIENIDGTVGYFDPALTGGSIGGVDLQNCVTFTPDVMPDTPCTFVAWVTDLNDVAGTTVSTTESFSASPSNTTTYYAIVDCGSGLQCVDEVIVNADLSLCEPPDEVPTVGEWGLMILGLLMLITAIVGIRARKENEIHA